MKLRTLIFVMAALGSSAFGQSDATLLRANDEFAKGEFREAIRDYQTLVDAKQWNAPVFYNLGNAYFRAGDLGKAILNYERALALDPRHPESAANLALVREEARALELQHGRLDAALKNVAAAPLTLAAAVAFWTMIFALAARVLNRH